jgi:capsular exopolysaccharide synthesis family protein
LGIDPSSSGLSEILSDKNGELSFQTVKNMIQTLGNETKIDVITSGVIPPNPSELLDSETFGRLIDQLRPLYDFIIIDSPPALPVADAAIISTRTDGVVIVSAAGSTRINQYLGAKDSIMAVGGSVLGAILNKIPLTRSYDDYGYRYGYGYGYGKKYGSYKNYKPYSANEVTKTREDK